jgi:hypothetical protein
LYAKFYLSICSPLHFLFFSNYDFIIFFFSFFMFSYLLILSFIFVLNPFFHIFWFFYFCHFLTTFDPQLFLYRLKHTSVTIILTSLSLDILLKLSLYWSLNISQILVFPIIIFEISYITFINSKFTISLFLLFPISLFHFYTVYSS